MHGPNLGIQFFGKRGLFAPAATAYGIYFYQEVSVDGVQNNVETGRMNSLEFCLFGGNQGP